MKPKTIIQKRIIDLAAALPKITEEQRAWALENCLPHVTYSNKTNHHCMDCGHVWKRAGETNTCTCPLCSHVLLIENTRNRTNKEVAYFAIAGVSDEIQMQVNRFWEIKATYKQGQKAQIYIYEVLQHWMDGGKRFEIVGLQSNNMFYSHSWSGNMEIRNKKSVYKYDICVTATYPEWDALPLFVRNGFNGDFHEQWGYDLFNGIVKNPKAETLFKAGYYRFLKTMISNANRMDEVYRYWNSVKICMRNGYEPTDVLMWLDYLRILDRLNKDLNSPTYVCPADLKAEHDGLLARLNRIEAEQRRRRNEEEKIKRQQRLELLTKEYLAKMQVFCDLKFGDDLITIKVLESVEEFKAEGEALKHCVFRSEYYTRTGSLILSARIDGQPVETIEVELTKMKIEQSRGMHNKHSPYHKRIVKLVQSHIPLIKEKYRKLKKATLVAA